jgi:hypothetical protein
MAGRAPDRLWPASTRLSPVTARTAATRLSVQHNLYRPAAEVGVCPPVTGPGSTEKVYWKNNTPHPLPIYVSEQIIELKDMQVKRGRGMILTVILCLYLLVNTVLRGE